MISFHETKNTCIINSILYRTSNLFILAANIIQFFTDMTVLNNLWYDEKSCSETLSYNVMLWDATRAFSEHGWCQDSNMFISILWHNHVVLKSMDVLVFRMTPEDHLRTFLLAELSRFDIYSVRHHWMSHHCSNANWMLGKTLPEFLRGRSITSIAVVFFLREAAHLTVDFAAPDELALALLLDFSNHSLVPSAAAQ